MSFQPIASPKTDAHNPVVEITQSLPNKRGTRKILKSVLALLLILVITTLLLGAKAKADLIAQYPPLGQMVDVGGYRLHINCQGTGSPTVIMEAGLGEPSLNWALVQPKVSTTTRVCVYDRAGLGWSDKSPKPRTANIMIEELHTLLKNASIEGPYVMVGHSTGGMLVRFYAHTYPTEVVGMVLVDSQHEEQFERLAPTIQQSLKAMFAQSNQTLPLYRILINSGISVLVPAVAALADNPKLPSPARETFTALAISDPKFIEAQAAEQDAIFDSLEVVRAAHITTLGNIPLVVLYRGIDDDPTPSLTPEENKQRWLSLQTELAALSPQGKLVLADKSGHHIQLDQPDLVIDAIEQVLAATHT
ncbi:MAG: alpha/beta fold hydrolase [Anaerolineaceae bacterium]|nr:alpha/beta fold hydrolase [Anaerolineaceae bacterium]